MRGQRETKEDIRHQDNDIQPQEGLSVTVKHHKTQHKPTRLCWKHLGSPHRSVWGCDCVARFLLQWKLLKHLWKQMSHKRSSHCAFKKQENLPQLTCSTRTSAFVRSCTTASESPTSRSRNDVRVSSSFRMSSTFSPLPKCTGERKGHGGKYMIKHQCTVWVMKTIFL